MLAIVQAVLSLFSLPFGTVIGTLILIYLFRSDVRAYFEGLPPGPPITTPPGGAVG